MDALHLANAAFRSTSDSLLWPIAVPQRRTTKIVLRQNGSDISGGDAILAGAAAFTSIAPAKPEMDGTKVYWATHLSAPRGGRLVVVDEPFNWRGDWYFVYLVPADFTPERLARERGAANSLLKPVLGNNRWSPPVILQDASGEYWLIDRGEPYELMPDWKVYTPARDRMVVKCRISFGYSPAADVSRMLPNVRNLAKALDEALGPGTGEGTLQQTAALRSEVAKAWANASLRPWALTDEPYNSRTEVEHGLEEWARGSAPRTALLDRIRKTYPSAERELGSYYRRAFEHSHQSAERLARKVLDHMLRSYFVFSKSRLGAA